MALVGNTVEQKIWNYLKSKGLNDYGIAGMIGNLYAESGLKPTNLQQTYEKSLNHSDDTYTKAVDNGTYLDFETDRAGYGLAQWTYPTRKADLLRFAKSKEKSIGDLEMQLDFLWKELTSGYKSVLNVLKTATSVIEASNAVLLEFERPSDKSTDIQNKRAGFGQEYYNKYAVTIDATECKYTKGTSVKLSQNFTSAEFDCHGIGCCSETIIDEKLIKYLQQIRNHFGAPITINSGYRCDKHNSAVGGASKSKHKYGQAADIVVKGVSPLKVAQYAESIGILGIGQYPGFVHIDTRTSKSYWFGSNEEYRSTFGKYVDESNLMGSAATTIPTTPVQPETPVTTEMYRVRKAWADSKSQIGAYRDLNNAKAACDKAGAGYYVFNSAGKVVYHVADKLEVGDAVTLVSGAKYTSGETPKPWVYTSTLYVRELRNNDTVAVVSTKKIGDITGVVYVKDLKQKGQASTATPAPTFRAYIVKVNANVLNIRKGAGTNYGIAGSIKDKGIYTIVAESTGKGATKWGKLKSGVGWISLDYCEKI